MWCFTASIVLEVKQYLFRLGAWLQARLKVSALCSSRQMRSTKEAQGWKHNLHTSLGFFFPFFFVAHCCVCIVKIQTRISICVVLLILSRDMYSAGLVFFQPHTSVAPLLSLWAYIDRRAVRVRPHLSTTPCTSLARFSSQRFPGRSIPRVVWTAVFGVDLIAHLFRRSLQFASSRSQHQHRCHERTGKYIRSINIYIYIYADGVAALETN